MRDVIWTIIAVWLVYRLVEMFRTMQPKKAAGRASGDAGSEPGRGTPQSGDLKDAVRRHINSTGEYVDFEEVKEEPPGRQER